MALSSSTVQPGTPAPTNTNHSVGSELIASLLSMIVLSVYAGQKSRKQLRKIKRKMAWLVLKEKAKSVFSKKEEISKQTLLYIILGVVVLALLIVSPIAALILALIALILILTKSI